LRTYIASFFADKDRVKARAKELEDLGITCTSRWALETAPHNCKITDCEDEYLRETAVADVDDFAIDSDALVLISPTDQEMVNLTPHQLCRGGRHVEFGIFYGLMLAECFLKGSTKRSLIILGRNENVFHFLDGKSVSSKYPAVQRFDTWEEVKDYLVSLRGATSGK